MKKLAYCICIALQNLLGMLLQNRYYLACRVSTVWRQVRKGVTNFDHKKRGNVERFECYNLSRSKRTNVKVRSVSCALSDVRQLGDVRSAAKTSGRCF